MKFVKCYEFDANRNEEILLNLNCVKKVRRITRDECADVVEDMDGNFYECYDFKEILSCPSIRESIIEL